MPFLERLYRIFIHLGTPALEGLLAWRTLKGKEDALRIDERRGHPSLERPQGRLVWIHAASVGEAQTALILIQHINTASRSRPSILITTGTRTSAQLMEQRLPQNALHHYIPLDHPRWVARFLAHWKPDLALWMESELWPVTLGAIKKNHIPAILVNARLSDRSFAAWSKIPGLAQSCLSAFTLILTQAETDARRFEFLGGQNVITTGNIKNSAPALPYDPHALQSLKNAIERRPMWLFASTHAGEERMACAIHKNLKKILPDLLTIVVPRHPDRRTEIQKICSESGLNFSLRGSALRMPASTDDLYIADTMGELGLFYAAAEIAVIGRSFSDDGGGGHNPIEAAQHHCIVLTGPNNQFQRPLYDELARANAVIEAEDQADLEHHLALLLQSPEMRAERLKMTRAYLDNRPDIMAGVMSQLKPYLDGLENRHAA